MKKQDVQLIQRILDGDEKAFTAIVEKYQKGIHTLAWQKTGDFHIAQEITQDTFLKAYQQLGTLKNRKLFCGWLYVIATNLCNDWLRKKRLPIQSLETVDTKEVDQVSYANYIEEQIEEDANESRRELIGNLLKKLPESERTVMSLHYLGEMSCESIGEFLGVSQNTIKSRLSRARNRLKKEELMLKENLSSFQLPSQFTEKIMENIMNSKPITPSVTKPLIPLAISAASAIIAVLLIGVGAQRIFHYQQPYSIDRDSEATIEIMDAKLVIDTPIKPTLSQQNGNSIVADKPDGIGHRFDNLLVSASESDESTIVPSKGKWIRARGPYGGKIVDIFSSSQQEIYAGTIHDLYRLSEDKNRWNLISSNVPFSGYWKLIEYNDKLYTVSDKQVFTSIDKGKTWNAQGVRPDGELITFSITDDGFYLALSAGVFHSNNSGSTWIPLNEGLEEKEIKSLIAVDNHLFVGTDSGLFRLSSNKWEQVTVDKNIENIQALAYADQKLYVAAGKNNRNQIISDVMKMFSTAKRNISLYRSTNLGDSWTNITPPKEPMKNPSTTTFTFSSGSGLTPLPSIELVTYQNCLIMHAVSDSYFSNDGGENWSILDRSFTNMDTPPVTAILNENTIYSGTNDGVFRSTDAGNRWQEVNTGILNKSIMDLMISNDILYAYIENALVISKDAGDTWHPLAGEISLVKCMVESNGDVYIKSSKDLAPQLYLVTNESNRVLPVPGIPKLEVPDFNEQLSDKIGKALLSNLEEEAIDSLHQVEKFNPEQFNSEQFNESYNKFISESMNQSLSYLIGSFDVHDTTFYMEFKNQLLRWKQGENEWHNTGLIDENATDASKDVSDLRELDKFKISVLDNTVYVGMMNGHLMQSLDEGETWTDVTSNLPFTVESFKTIVFAGESLYVATDKGVVRSTDGKDWETLSDENGIPLVMNRLAVADTTVYGESEQIIYSVNWNNDKWKQVTPKIENTVSCIDTDGKTLYVGTFGSGLLRFILDE